MAKWGFTHVPPGVPHPQSGGSLPKFKYAFSKLPGCGMSGTQTGPRKQSESNSLSSLMRPLYHPPPPTGANLNPIKKKTNHFPV